MSNVLVYLVKSTPPVTRILTSVIAIVFILSTLGYVYGSTFSFSKFHLLDIVLNKKYPQLYRLLSSVYYFGKPNVENYLHILFFYRYSCMLEESYMYISDYLYIIFCCHILLLIASCIVFVPNMGPALSCIITYIWTKKNPRTLVQAYGFVTFHAFYIPFLLPVYTLITQKTINIEEVLGITVGHIVFFFRERHQIIGVNILKTPCFLHRLFKEEQSCCKKEEVKTEQSDMSRIKNMIQDKLRASKEAMNKQEEEVSSKRREIPSDYESDEFTERTKTSPYIGEYELDKQPVFAKRSIPVKEVKKVEEAMKEPVEETRKSEETKISETEAKRVNEESKNTKIEEIPKEPVTESSEGEISSVSEFTVSEVEEDLNDNMTTSQSSHTAPSNTSKFDIDSSESIKEVSTTDEPTGVDLQSEFSKVIDGEKLKQEFSKVIDGDKLKNVITGSFNKLNEFTKGVMTHVGNELTGGDDDQYETTDKNSNGENLNDTEASEQNNANENTDYGKNGVVHVPTEESEQSERSYTSLSEIFSEEWEEREISEGPSGESDENVGSKNSFLTSEEEINESEEDNNNKSTEPENMIVDKSGAKVVINKNNNVTEDSSSEEWGSG